MRIALWVLLGLLLLLLFWPVRISVTLRPDQKAVQLGPFTLKKGPAKPKRRKKEKPKKQRELEEPEQKIRDMLSQVRLILPSAKTAFRLFRSGIVIQLLRFVVHYDTGDPARTGMSYGPLCAIVFPFFAWFDQWFRVRAQQIAVIPVFDGQSRFEYDFVLRVRCSIALALVCALTLAWGFVKVQYKLHRSQKQHKQRVQRAAS